MNRIVSTIAASALISAALVGGLAAANGSRSAATAEAAAWTNPPSAETGCRADCAAAAPSRKVRVIAIDGRAWPAGAEAAERDAARKTASR